jgi:hypothetical protein
MVLFRISIIISAFISLLAWKNSTPVNPPSNETTWIKNIVQKLEVTEYFWALSSKDELYVTGYFNDTAVIGNQKIVSLGSQDIFIAKFTNDGKLQWVKQAGGKETDIVKLIKIDSNDNLYITGYFTVCSYFDKYVAKAQGRTDIFSAKYNTAGELQWVKSEGAQIVCEPNAKKRIALFQKYNHSKP